MAESVSRALIVGGGSIGTRHARVLADMGHTVAIVTGRDDLDGPTFRSVGDGVRGHLPDYVVIATPTADHAESVAALAAEGYRGDVLVEKPLAVDASAVDAAGFARTGVGFNLRFHPALEALGAALAGRRAIGVEVHAGQHLSTWRSRPVADQYSAHRHRGGGVLRDLSHELDYLHLLFGACTGVFARGGRMTEVTVDSDDFWSVVAAYQEAALVSIQINYLDRPARRRIVVTTDDVTLEADLVASTLTVGEETTSFPTERDQTYRAMHTAMLDGDARVASVADSVATDRVIEMIETSGVDERWVTA